MVDRIFIENLRLKCKVGTQDEERRVSQEILVDVSLTVGLGRAGASDNLDDTIDYRDTIERISQFVTGGEFQLLESLAEGIAAIALKSAGVERVTVQVRKAKYSNEPSIGIEIERNR
ncbi:MAG: dihydroneopterin aldolase [Nitrososphaerota archaeon]|jgi:FolB domain-containing protein|nr:dihydroneopterin aldolase [Nitrososphaerota archaeon]MDG6946436.1 dihydroneopterin aldolase [Nitrososphaerota archaeon]